MKSLHFIDSPCLSLSLHNVMNSLSTKKFLLTWKKNYIRKKIDHFSYFLFERIFTSGKNYLLTKHWNGAHFNMLKIYVFWMEKIKQILVNPSQILFQNQGKVWRTILRFYMMKWKFLVDIIRILRNKLLYQINNYEKFLLNDLKKIIIYFFRNSSCENFSEKQKFLKFLVSYGINHGVTSK